MAGEVVGDPSVLQRGFEIVERDDALAGEGCCRCRIDAGELDQPPDQPRQGRPARADGEAWVFQHDLAQLPVECRRNIQIGEAIVTGQIGESCDGRGAKLLDVGRQTPPGTGVERRAADLCEIAELTKESGEVRRRHQDTIRPRLISVVPSDGPQGAIRYSPHGARGGSTGPVSRLVRVLLVSVHEPSLRPASTQDAPQEHRPTLAAYAVVVAAHIASDPAPHGRFYSLT